MTKPNAVHYRTVGEGPLPLLAIHCTLSHSGSWQSVGEFLADKVTLTAVDLPGHGKSGDWDGAGDVQDACIQAVLPFLSRPTHLVGHSFGATIALRLAIEQPEKVRSLTLIEPVLFAAAKSREPELLAQNMSDAQPYLEALAHHDMSRAAQLFNRIWGDGTKWADFPPKSQRYMTNRMKFIPAQDPSLFGDHARLLTPGRLERAAMPTALIEGTESPKIITAINAALAERLPDVRRIHIPGAGHMAPMTHPKAVATTISDLLEVAEEQIDLI